MSILNKEYGPFVAGSAKDIAHRDAWGDIPERVETELGKFSIARERQKQNGLSIRDNVGLLEKQYPRFATDSYESIAIGVMLEMFKKAKKIKNNENPNLDSTTKPYNDDAILNGNYKKINSTPKKDFIYDLEYSSSMKKHIIEPYDSSYEFKSYEPDLDKEASRITRQFMPANLVVPTYGENGQAPVEVTTKYPWGM